MTTTGEPEMGMSNYQGVHRRLRLERGPARSYPCVSCGNQAADWAYQHTGVELVDTVGVTAGRKFSEDIWNDYKPLCKSCHVLLDHQHNPEWKENLTARARELGLQPKEFAHLSAAGKLGGPAAARSRAKDPEMTKRHSENAVRMGPAGRAALASLRRRCTVCGKESTKGGMYLHQRSQGHEGYEDLT